MITTTAAYEPATVRATITTPLGRITTDVRCHESGDLEGAVDERHLSEIVHAHLVDMGDRWPTTAVCVDVDRPMPAADGTDDGWTWALVDAHTQDTIGSMRIHHGAGA